MSMAQISTFPSVVTRTEILRKITPPTSRKQLILMIYLSPLIQRRVRLILRTPVVSLPSLSMTKLGFSVRGANTTTLLTPLKPTSRKVILFLLSRHLLYSQKLMPLILFEAIVSPKLISMMHHLILYSALLQ